MSLKDKAKQWLLGLALKKAVVSAAKLIVSGAAARGIAISASYGGVSIDLSSEAAMVIAINSALTMLRNYLKTRFPESCGWL